MIVADSITDLIGSTPLLHLKSLSAVTGGSVFAKLELFNPAGSIKDRVGFAMLADAEKKGLIDAQTVIIEATSGNTGIGLASVAASKGYRLVIVMPDSMSIERRTLLSALGAELVLTPASEGMAGAIAKSEELRKKYGNAFIPSQFENPANPEVHYHTTGPEIWEALNGKVDALVSSVGTGGTVSGTGKFLKEKNSSCLVVAVEPSASPVLSGGKPGTQNKIQGIGAGFVPKVLSMSLLDEIITVDNDEAFEMCRKMGKQEGLLCGISSGAAACAVLKLAKKRNIRNRNIVVIFPDSGERYLSSAVY